MSLFKEIAEVTIKWTETEFYKDNQTELMCLNDSIVIVEDHTWSDGSMMLILFRKMIYYCTFYLQFILWSFEHFIWSKKPVFIVHFAINYIEIQIGLDRLNGNKMNLSGYYCFWFRILLGCYSFDLCCNIKYQIKLVKKRKTINIIENLFKATIDSFFFCSYINNVIHEIVEHRLKLYV